MRICIERATGKLIEMQSGAMEGLLTKNALVQGYKIEDILEKEATQAEFEAALYIANAPARESLATEKAILIAREKEIADSLTAWIEISDSLDTMTKKLDEATTIAGVKVALKDLVPFIKKLSRVVYIHVKNSTE